jgi:hypothetical protein
MGYERHRLGKDTQGAPSLLIAVGDTAGRGRPDPIALEHLTIQHGVECRVSRPDGTTEEGRFTVIRCAGRDRALHAYFLRVASAIVASLGAEPAALDVTRTVDRLVELFRAMTMPPRKSMQGLWAELFLIARSREPAILVSAWHMTPEDRYDFSTGEQRIEVKSAAGRVRQHHFTLEQLYPPIGTKLLIASVLVERTGAGPSVVELAEQVRSGVSSTPDFLLHVDRIVGLTLGQGWRQALEERFDRELAEQSLAFFDPSAVPRVGEDVPAGISDVRFKSDLSGSQQVDLAQYRAAGGLFRAALRRR